MSRILGNSLKTISVLNSTVVGMGLMGGEKMEAIPHAVAVGGVGGFILGSLAMYGASKLEEKKQVIPILAITGALAMTYPYSAPAIHKIMLDNELNKITYNYNDSVDSLKNDPRYQYDKEKMTLALSAYNEVKPRVNNPYTSKREKLELSKDSYIYTKYLELVKGKYDNRGHRTSWYSKQIEYAMRNNHKGIIIGNGISKHDLKSGKEDLAIKSIATIFYYDSLEKVITSEKEFGKSILSKSKSLKVVEAYNTYKNLTKEHILEIRTTLQKAIQEEILKAKTKVYNEEEIAEVMKIVGVIVEIILTPFMMWLGLLSNTPKPTELLNRAINSLRSNKTRKTLIEAKEDVLIKNLDTLLKKHQLVLTQELKRILYIVQVTLKNDIKSFDGLPLSKFRKIDNNQIHSDIDFPNNATYRRAMKFVEHFASKYSNSSYVTTEDILATFVTYKKAQ